VRRGPPKAERGADAGPAAPRSGGALITAAEVSGWVGSLVARGLAPSTATRALATLRSVLAFAVADARVQHNVAASVRNPTSGRARREGQALTLDELETLTEACKGRYRDVVPVLALAGLRWGELAGLQVGDRVSVPGPGLRLRRAMLAGGGGGAWMPTCGRPPGLSGTSRDI
jgi:integrase